MLVIRPTSSLRNVMLSLRNGCVKSPQRCVKLRLRSSALSPQPKKKFGENGDIALVKRLGYSVQFQSFRSSLEIDLPQVTELPQSSWEASDTCNGAATNSWEVSDTCNGAATRSWEASDTCK